jgi:hypothetical protein
MGAFSDLINSALGNTTEGYDEAVKRRQQTGRLTTGGTGYSDKQTRALRFAQDVARGWSAQALGDTMANGTPQAAAAVNAAKAAQSGVEGNSNYNALNSLDAAQRRSEGLQVDEENKMRAEKYENAMGALEGTVGAIQQGVQLGTSGTKAAKAAKASGERWNKTTQGIKDAWANHQARKSAKNTAKLNQQLSTGVNGQLNPDGYTAM